MLVGIAVAQVYIPTGVSTQSGIVRNVPTQIVRIPADTYINDGRQTYLAAQVPLQILNTNNRGTNNNIYANTQNNRQHQTLNVREENLRRLIESESRLRDLLLLVDQDNDNQNNNYNTNNNNNNNRFTTFDTLGTSQDQSIDTVNDNTNFNRNTLQNTLQNRGQLRTLVSTSNHDTTDLTRRFRTNTDTTGLHRLRDTTSLGRL